MSYTTSIPPEVAAPLLRSYYSALREGDLIPEYLAADIVKDAAVKMHDGAFYVDGLRFEVEA